MAKEEEPLHVDLAEQNGAAQREAKVSNKKLPVFEGTAYFFCLYQVMEMAKRFGGAKQKCLQRIRSKIAIAIVGYQGRTKTFFRSNLHMGKVKGSSEEREELGESGGTVEERNGSTNNENRKSVVNDDEQFRTNR